MAAGQVSLISSFESQNPEAPKIENIGTTIETTTTAYTQSSQTESKRIVPNESSTLLPQIKTFV